MALGSNLATNDTLNLFGLGCCGAIITSRTFSFVLDAKLRALKAVLKTWNKEVSGFIEARKGEALSQVVYWDEKEKGSALNLEESEARKEAREAYKNWVLRKEISWRQKSREVWLKEGDNNTRFFHRMSNAHSRRNWLSKMKVNGCCIDGLSFTGLDSSEIERLELPFSEKEVFATLSNLGKDKALGISMRGQICDVFECYFPCSCSKEGRCGRPDRSISLVGNLYVVLIANEAMDSRLKCHEGGVLCKLDIEKAYDHVTWKFLFAVLRKMGFGERWIKWRSLRQGDPLSPYLFVIAMEVFTCLLRRAISGGFLFGWRVRVRSGKGILISHLLFDDDTLVFIEASQDQMTYLS
ncbi:hypothetical protein CK203_106156 [Vitis vinifera]|uniref:Reverse transcriptase domain-containing protein n=1 Tax=Vitis vinifera TaxID=29760 RepID=A0A438CCY9_VITVI|nr:hypothetical protein CK203_106156 [Vitis vinifera]